MNTLALIVTVVGVTTVCVIGALAIVAALFLDQAVQSGTAGLTGLEDVDQGNSHSASAPDSIQHPPSGRLVELQAIRGCPFCRSVRRFLARARGA